MGLRGKGSTPQVLRRPVRLSHAQEQSLLYGDLPGRGAFGSEGEFRAAWELHRGRLLGEAAPGRRPQGWWLADAGPNLRWPGYSSERSVLWQAGVLDAAERAELECWWRGEYLRAHTRDFRCCLGPGRFLKGAPARRAHYKWADIPKSLLVQWTKERRRQRKPAVSAAEPPAVA